MRSKLIKALMAAAAAVTALFTPLAAKAADAPSDLKIKGWTVNGQEWQNIDCTEKSADGKIFYFKVTLGNGRIFKFQEGADGQEWGPGTVKDDPIHCDVTRELKTGSTAFTVTGSSADNYIITADFSGTTPTVLVREAATDYYFVGDLNDWWYNGIYGNDEADFEAEKDNWKFTYDPASGYYVFKNFPDNLLSGQFKIIPEGAIDRSDFSWNGTEFCHRVDVDYDHTDRYREYINAPIRREDIVNGNPCTLSDGRSIVVRKNDGDLSGWGGNLHLECNAVREATIYFNPDKPELKVVGNPVDYFIFYGREDVSTDEETVIAKIVEGKPNADNYFLPGTNGLPSAVEGEEHMRVGNGIHLIKVPLVWEYNESLETNVLKNEDEVRSELNGIIFADQMSAANSETALVDYIISEHRLPNKYVIENLKELWLIDVPTGYENPAGVNYAMQLTTAPDEEFEGQEAVLGLRHIYFLPHGDALHVHLNDEDLDFGPEWTLDFSYRLYYVDAADFHTWTIPGEHLWRSTTESEGSRVRLSTDNRFVNKTANSTEERKNACWVPLDTRKTPEEWGGRKRDTDYPDVDWWKVNWRAVESAANGPVKEGAENKDLRTGISSRYGQGHLQFKLEVTNNYNAANSFTMYLPESPSTESNDKNYLLDNKDFYLKATKEGVFTGVDGVSGDFPVGKFLDLDENGNIVAPVYYNMQGVRVDNPESGLYIKVTGTKSEKVYIR